MHEVNHRDLDLSPEVKWSLQIPRPKPDEKIEEVTTGRHLLAATSNYGNFYLFSVAESEDERGQSRFLRPFAEERVLGTLGVEETLMKGGSVSVSREDDSAACIFSTQ